jgi:hypothetical protein
MNSLTLVKESVNICVYCYSIVDEMCWNCREYDGIMNLKDAEKYLVQDFTDYLD